MSNPNNGRVEQLRADLGVSHEIAQEAARMEQSMHHGSDREVALAAIAFAQVLSGRVRDLQEQISLLTDEVTA